MSMIVAEAAATLNQESVLAHRDHPSPRHAVDNNPYFLFINGYGRRVRGDLLVLCVRRQTLAQR